MVSEATVDVDKALRQAFVDILGLEAERVALFDGETALFGAIPELDSMAVATLLTEIEERLDIWIEDDEFEAEILETYGNLLRFTNAKVDGAA